MPRLLALAAIAGLAACTETAEQPAPAETATPAPEAAAAEQGVASGSYDVSGPDGAMGTTVINADGSYLSTDAAGGETRGAYARRNGQDCFDPAGEAPEMCWTINPPAADGSFTATSSDGTEVTITPRTEPAVATTAPPTG